MSVKRALNLDGTFQTPAKRKELVSMLSTLPGTSSLQADVMGHNKTPTKKPTRADVEKMQTLQTELERSMTEYVMAKKELEEIVASSTEGSSELSSFFQGRSADFMTELKRHGVLVCHVESLKEKNDLIAKPASSK